MKARRARSRSPPTRRPSPQHIKEASSDGVSKKQVDLRKAVPANSGSISKKRIDLHTPNNIHVAQRVEALRAARVMLAFAILPLLCSGYTLRLFLDPITSDLVACTPVTPVGVKPTRPNPYQPEPTSPAPSRIVLAYDYISYGFG